MLFNGQSAAKVRIEQGSTTISLESRHKCVEGVCSDLGKNIVSATWKHVDAKYGWLELTTQVEDKNIVNE